MFTKCITSLTLASGIADGMFGNIIAPRYMDDVSFVATLRALMHNRVPDGGQIVLTFTKSNYGAHTIENASGQDCVSAFLSGGRIVRGTSGCLHIHSFEGDSEGNDACFKKLDSGAVIEYLNWLKPADDMNHFFEQRKIKARFYLSEERNSALIFIEGMTMRKWHLLQSMVPRYFPGYFAEKPLEGKELKLIKSLTNRYAPEYEELIEEAAKQFDFRTEMIRSNLKGFESGFHKIALRETRNEIDRYRERIRELERQFSNYYQNMDELTTRELGLVEKIKTVDDNEDSELMEYFLCNKGLDIVEVRDGTIQFIVKTVISSFDPDMFDSVIHRKESFFYRHYETGRSYGNPELTDDRIKKLMLAIFRDETLKLRVCAAYWLDFKHGEYRGLSGYSYPDDVLKDHTPNQHIQHYACLGNNRAVVADAMVRRDYVSAVSACCSSASNINLTESNTGTFFMQKICDPAVGRIIQMPDGTTMTPVDAVKWLEEQEKAKEEEKHEQAD